MDRELMNRSMAIIPRTQLAPEQLKIVEMPSDKHLFCTGPAGSGKTQMLIHRALHLARLKKLPSDRYCLFVLTDVAKNFIRADSSIFDLSAESVTTLDVWCEHFYKKHISKDLPRIYINLKLDRQEIRSKVLQELQRWKRNERILDFAVVDDGQDLAPEFYEILPRVAWHITVFADFRQKILENATSESLISEKLEVDRATRVPGNSYINDIQILKLAAYFDDEAHSVLDGFEREAIALQGSEKPQCHIAPSFDQEIDHLAETLRLRLGMGERAGIILPRPQLLHDLAKELLKRGLPVEKIVEPDAQNVLHDSYDLRNQAPKMLTYFSAKGLTFDSVFLPQLTEKNYHNLDDVLLQRMLFFGISRAKHWVYFSTVRGAESRLIEMLIRAQSEDSLLMF